jgi:K+-transporting ATPase ATPase C chain
VGYGSGTPPSSGASNLAPGNPDLAARVAADAAALAAEGIATPAPDLLTSSGSGLDPDVSLAAALQQLPRIAAARGLPAAELESLLDRHTHRPLLGLAGPRLVNVLTFNLALDKPAP